MIKITERCTMGCSHCMNNAMTSGKDMTTDILRHSLDFLKDNNIGKVFILSGGEPTEHRKFDEMMQTIIDWQKDNQYLHSIFVTTNGENIANDWKYYVDLRNRFKLVNINLQFQISADVRYYPRRIPVHKRIFREEGFLLVDDCVEQIYPQGRAKENDIPWQSKCSKCFNCRAISHQKENCTLQDIEVTLFSYGKFCTPHVSVDGDIKLGESDLCPTCCSIFDSSDVIMQSIKEFKCNQCDFINDQLDEFHKKFL